MPKSSLALSNIRGFLILLVIAFHSFLAYLGSTPASPAQFNSPPYAWVAYPIVDSARWFGFDLFCAFLYVFMMQFMFFLSGLFVWPSLQSKGAKIFVQSRSVRLGVPFVLGICLLMPAAHYPVYLVTALDPSWSAFWQQWKVLPFWPTGQLWFLWFLLALDVLAAGLYRMDPDGVLLGRLLGPDEPSRYVARLVMVTAAGYLPLAVLFEPWEWLKVGPFSFQPSFSLIYVIYFFAGIAVGVPGIESGLLSAGGSLARRWSTWSAGAFIGFVLWIIPTALSLVSGGATAQALKIFADFGFVLSSALSCFGILSVFLRFFATRSPVLESLSRNAYGMYVFHYLFVVWLQYGLLNSTLFAASKAGLVFTGSAVLSWTTAAGLGRITIGPLIFGRERRRVVMKAHSS